MAKNTSKGFSVRLKPELKEWVLKSATKNMRSMNSEINVLLIALKNQTEKKDKKA